MLRSLLIGFLSGARSLSPVAVASLAAERGRLTVGGGPAGLLAGPKMAAGLRALAIGEALGDKMKSAPDRIVPAGMAVRLVTGALAGRRWRLQATSGRGRWPASARPSSAAT